MDFMKSVGADNATLRVVSDMHNEDYDKLAQYRQEANKLVRTYITLIPEEMSEAKMSAAIGATHAGKLRGGTKAVGRHRHSRGGRGGRDHLRHSLRAADGVSSPTHLRHSPG